MMEIQNITEIWGRILKEKKKPKHPEVGHWLQEGWE